MLQVRASSAGPPPQTLSSNKGSINSGLDSLTTTSMAPINTGITFNPLQLQQPLQQPTAQQQGRLSPVNKTPTPKGQGSLSPSRGGQSGQASPVPSGGYGQALGLGQMMLLTNLTSGAYVNNSATSMTPLSSTTNSVTSMASRDREREKDIRDTALAPPNNGHAQQNFNASAQGMSVYSSSDGQQDGEIPELGPIHSNSSNNSTNANNDWFTFSSPAEPPPRG